MVRKKTKRPKTPKSVWCPACGVARNARYALKSYLRKKKKVKFQCKTCGFVCDFTVPEKEKKEEVANLSAKDLKTVGTLAGMAGKLIKG